METPCDNAHCDGPGPLRQSQVLAGLSRALDITEGQPEGHAARSCLIGMRVGRELRLGEAESAALFYALLMKDLGCSSNAARMSSLFGADDRVAKRELKVVDWPRLMDGAAYVARTVLPGTGRGARLARFVKLAVAGKEPAREMFRTRCERGAEIARDLRLPDAAAAAIRALDEHWDGRGYPDGLRAERIPLLARVLNLAQTVEVFWKGRGLAAAVEMARERSGSWFDPALVRAFEAVAADEPFWRRVAGGDVVSQVAAVEPPDQTVPADDDTLDRVAGAFGRVIDAKSPWTFRHSEGVSEVATGVGRALGMTPPELRRLRRAAILHDVGKLGVSNLILDKPGRLTDEEMAVVRRHPAMTYHVLSAVGGFSDVAEMAASHHERPDGAGYHRGVAGGDLPLASRVLAVADMFEALSARRPYRQDLGEEEVMSVLARQAGRGVCPVALEGLKAFVAAGRFTPVRLAA